MAKPDQYNLRAVQLDLEREKILSLGGAAKLSAKAIDNVLNKITVPRALNDNVLAALVASGGLKTKEAQSFGLASNIFHLVDENLELVGALTGGRFPRLASGKIVHVRDLTALNHDDWRALLDQHEIVAPDGSTRADYARTLVDRV